MNETLRPFYAEYAWAFDLIIDRPVEKECAVIAAWLVSRGILPGAEILATDRLVAIAERSDAPD